MNLTHDHRIISARNSSCFVTMSKDKSIHSSKKVSKKSSAKRPSRSERKKSIASGSSMSLTGSLSPPVPSIADELAYAESSQQRNSDFDGEERRSLKEEAEMGSSQPEERPLGEAQIAILPQKGRVPFSVNCLFEHLFAIQVLL